MAENISTNPQGKMLRQTRLVTPLQSGMRPNLGTSVLNRPALSPAERIPPVPDEMSERKPQVATPQKEKLPDRIKNKITEWKKKLNIKGNASTIMKELSVIGTNIVEARRLRKENTAWKKTTARMERRQKRASSAKAERTTRGESRLGRTFSQLSNEVRATFSPETRAMRKRLETFRQEVKTTNKDRKAKLRKENREKRDRNRKKNEEERGERRNTNEARKTKQRAERARERAKIVTRAERKFAHNNKDAFRKAYHDLTEERKQELGVTVLPLNEQNALLAPAIRQAQETTRVHQEQEQEAARQQTQTEQTKRVQEQNRQQQERARYEAEVRTSKEYIDAVEQGRQEIFLTTGRSANNLQEDIIQQQAFRAGAEAVNDRRVREAQQAVENRIQVAATENARKVQERIIQLQQNELTSKQFDAAFTEELAEEMKTASSETGLTPSFIDQVQEKALERYDRAQEDQARMQRETQQNQDTKLAAERKTAKANPAYGYQEEVTKRLLLLTAEQRRDPGILQRIDDTATEIAVDKLRAANIPVEATTTRKQQITEPLPQTLQLDATQPGHVTNERNPISGPLSENFNARAVLAQQPPERTTGQLREVATNQDNRQQAEQLVRILLDPTVRRLTQQLSEKSGQGSESLQNDSDYLQLVTAIATILGGLGARVAEEQT